MAYINQAPNPRRRLAAVAGVATVHAALALGLLSLSVAVKKDVAPPWAPFVITPDPLPSPSAEPAPIDPPPAAANPPVSMPPPLVPAPPAPIEPPADDASNLGPGLGPVAGPVLPTPTPAPMPQPVPAFTPKAAVPSNAPDSWISNDDYPARALRDELEGVAGYRVIVGSNGRVSSCEITRSTGSRALDEATCRQISRRARFEAATDERGNKVLGSFAGSVRWEIPD